MGGCSSSLLLLLLLVVVLLLVWLLPASMVVKLLFRMLLLMLIQVEFDSAKLLRVRLPTKWWFLQKGKQSLKTETHKINKRSHIFQGFFSSMTQIWKLIFDDIDLWYSWLHFFNEDRFPSRFLQLIWPKLQNRRCANFRSILQKKNTFWKWWWEWLFRKCSFPDLSQDWGLLKRARPQMAPTINGTRICATRPFFTAKLCDFFICTCIANPTLPPTRFSSQFCHKEEWTDHKITII